MVDTTLKVNNRSYVLQCDEGQEQYVHEIARRVDSIVAEQTAALGQIGEGRLLLMTAMQLMDELLRTRKQLEALQKRVARSAKTRRGAQRELEAASDTASQEQVTMAVQRVHSLTRNLSKAAQSIERDLSSLDTEGSGLVSGLDKVERARGARKMPARKASKPATPKPANRDVQPDSTTSGGAAKKSRKKHSA